MNVFLIPSWYPSVNDPFRGYFFKEQAEAITSMYPDINVGISIWGQNEEKLLINKKDHIKNLLKVINAPSAISDKKLASNLYEFYTPALTWTKKLFKGNIDRIIKANEKNLIRCKAQFSDINIIHAHVSYPAGYIAMKLSRKFSIPYILTEHMSPFPFKDFIHQKGRISDLVVEPLKQSNENIVVSPLQVITMKELGIKESVYIPNFVNGDFFKPIEEKEITSRAFTFFTLGEMVPRKGIHILLEAIRHLSHIHKNINFRLGDNGAYLSYYQDMAKKLNLKNITWLGVIDRENVKTEFQNCNAFVLPSFKENMPLVFLEAIACGCPIIATRCGGPEYIVNEKNGLLVETGNAIQLAEAMIKMIDNYTLYDKDVIRKDFEERFSKEVVIPKIKTVYDNVVNY